MISFWRIFWLEILSLTRSKTLTLLTAAGIGWMLVFPLIVKGDGTEEGARELYVHFSLGGVFALLVVALLASATGSLASERTARRLQLTLVRPVRYFAVVFGKILAHVTVGTVVLAASCLVLLLRVGPSRPCSHVLSPVLPSPQEEAKVMYEEYMKAPDTPEAVRKAKKDVVMRILTQRAIDHYQTLPTNEVVTWQFDSSSLAPRPSGLSVRMRFTNQFEMRQDVVGTFRLAGMTGAVSNITQAVLQVPLTGLATNAAPELAFENRGKTALMLRPRKDIHLLVPADGFGWNLLRAFVGMVAGLMLVVSIGLFLSSALGRPVALFVAFSALIVGEMSPSVVDQYPSELEAGVADRIGLFIARTAAEVTRPVSSLSPMEALAKDECVEAAKIAKSCLADMVVLPCLLSLLAAFVLPRKQGD